MPTIEEEIEALAARLHPNYLSVKITQRKRAEDGKVRTEHVVIVQVLGQRIVYTADSLPLMKADLKKRLDAEQKDTTDG